MNRTRQVLSAAALFCAAEAAQAQSCDVTEVLTYISACDAFIGNAVPLAPAIRGWCYLGTSGCILF